VARVSAPVQVFLCDDVAAIRLLLRIAIESDSGLEIAGEAEDGQTAASEIARLQPDVVILDLSMPGLDGLELIPHIRETSAATKILVLSGYSADVMRAPALAAGASRYIEKGGDLDDVRAAIHELVAGQRRAG
jgi:DNA-binding NarL/FixJ family response regulator